MNDNTQENIVSSLPLPTGIFKRLFGSATGSLTGYILAACAFLVVVCGVEGFFLYRTIYHTAEVTQAVKDSNHQATEAKKELEVRYVQVNNDVQNATLTRLTDALGKLRSNSGVSNLPKEIASSASLDATLGTSELLSKDLTEQKDKEICVTNTIVAEAFQEREKKLEEVDGNTRP